jgi:hypothetical protein
MDYNSIYFEALWVLVLFAATATLREATGELCVHRISKTILSHSFISGKSLDVFISCSNGGRSLGFGAAWRMWNIDKSGAIERRIVVLPFCCWLIGMPIKLIAVQAVRGGNEILGGTGTWVLGFFWIGVCVAVKIVAFLVNRYHGMKDKNGNILSYRRIFQSRFCQVESYGMMIKPEEYDDSESYFEPKPKGSPLGMEIYWTDDDENQGNKTLKILLGRQD